MFSFTKWNGNIQFNCTVSYRALGMVFFDSNEWQFHTFSILVAEGGELLPSQMVILLQSYMAEYQSGRRLSGSKNQSWAMDASLPILRTESQFLVSSPQPAAIVTVLSRLTRVYNYTFDAHQVIIMVSVLQFVQREKWLSRYVICVCVCVSLLTFGPRNWFPWNLVCNTTGCHNKLIGFNFRHLTTSCIDLKQDGSHTNIIVPFSIWQ